METKSNSNLGDNICAILLVGVIIFLIAHFCIKAYSLLDRIENKIDTILIVDSISNSKDIIINKLEDD